MIFIHEEVKDALSENRGVVALESTIISHGLPHPENLETALALERIIRSEGAVPATIAIIEGVLHVGLERDQLEALALPNADSVIHKVSRRDLGYLLANKLTGSTTVAATMIAAERAGIRIFATGGLGGVHRGVETTMDISADLTELSKTAVAVVCAGVKSILDIEKTLEVLETYGVPVIGFGTRYMPEFYCEGWRYPLEAHAQTPDNVADILRAHWGLGLESGVVIAQSPPKETALPHDVVEGWIAEALAAAQQQGIKGKRITPFVLSEVVKRSGGRTLAANIALVKHNASLAAKIANCLY